MNEMHDPQVAASQDGGSQNVAPCAIGVSIINYKTAELTVQCVASVLADFAHDPEHPIDGQVVVVDNASGDGSDRIIADWIAEQPADTPVRLVCSDVNSGFSGGHNTGIAALNADYVLVLNSDAILRPGFCAAMLESTKATPDAGLFAPRIDYEDGTQQVSCFRVHSPISELIRAAGMAPVTKLLKRWDVALPMPPNPNEIGWASFACILLDMRMVNEIGPMDEGYFLYFEDTEYCLRARRAGWTITHVPAARAVHFRGGSAPVKSLAKAHKRLPRYFYESRARLFAQAYGRVGLWSANLLWHFGRILSRTKQMLGKPAHLTAEAEARDIWTNAWRPIQPRQVTDE